MGEGLERLDVRLVGCQLRQWQPSYRLNVSKFMEISNRCQAESERLASGCGTTTVAATSGSVGTSHRKSPVAAAAPSNCATMNAGASAGRIPANVSVADRASVTAGLANDVEAVNQYAAVMYEATAKGTADERKRAQPQITASSPKVATNSLKA